MNLQQGVSHSLSRKLKHLEIELPRKKAMLMNKTHAGITILALSLILTGCQQPSVTVVSPGATQNGLHVSGSSKVRATPTLVVLRLGCAHSSRQASIAKEKTEDSIRKIIAAIRAQGIPAEEVQTTDFSLNSEWDYERKVTNWRCSTLLEVRIKEISKAGKVLDAALDAGSNLVQGVDYTIEELQTLRAKARDEVCKVAKAKAEQLAKNLGVKLGKPISIAESYPGEWSFDPNRSRQNVATYEIGAHRPTNTENTLSSGSVAVELSVEVTYDLE